MPTLLKISITHHDTHLGNIYTSDDALTEALDGILSQIEGVGLEMEKVDVDIDGIPELADILNTHASYPKRR